MVEFCYPVGATKLDPDESAGLIPKHIITQEQLNEWEQSNIIVAKKWAFVKNKSSVLTVEFTKTLHKEMFGRTWEWAGTFRRSNKNIGVDWALIHSELGKLLEETNYYLLNNTFPVKEIAARFHHRLVFIH